MTTDIVWTVEMYTRNTTSHSAVRSPQCREPRAGTSHFSLRDDMQPSALYQTVAKFTGLFISHFIADASVVEQGDSGPRLRQQDPRTGRRKKGTSLDPNEEGMYVQSAKSPLPTSYVAFSVEHLLRNTGLGDYAFQEGDQFAVYIPPPCTELSSIAAVLVSGTMEIVVKSK